MNIMAFAVVVSSTFPDVRVKRVYDGDTIFADLQGVPEVLGEDIGIRIKGIDTPELTDSRKCMRNKAEKAKAALTKIIADGNVKLTHCERDKYFRLLCNIHVAEKYDAGSYLLDHRFAKPYSGGKKLKWTCDEFAEK